MSTETVKTYPNMLATGWMKRASMRVKLYGSVSSESKSILITNLRILFFLFSSTWILSMFTHSWFPMQDAERQCRTIKNEEKRNKNCQSEECDNLKQRNTIWVKSGFR